MGYFLTSLDALALLDFVLTTFNLPEQNLGFALHLSHEASLFDFVGVIIVMVAVARMALVRIGRTGAWRYSCW